MIAPRHPIFTVAAPGDRVFVPRVETEQDGVVIWMEFLTGGHRLTADHRSSLQGQVDELVERVEHLRAREEGAP